MKHLAEDELIELYYGEGTSAANSASPSVP